MDCSVWREVISADLDGETSSEERAALEMHLGSCAACRGFAGAGQDLARLSRVRLAERVPDLSGPILAAAGSVLTPAARAARWMLAWVAAVELVLAMPALLLGQSDLATEHVARHLGAFNVAIASGLLYAAWRPSRAAALLPLVVVLNVCSIGATTLDLIDGSTSAAFEAHHVIELTGLALLWVLAGMPRPRRRARHTIRMA